MDSKKNLAAGFEDTPHMIPGHVESAQQIATQSHRSASKNWKFSVLLTVLTLLVAGGWAYSNQKELKRSLGYAATGIQNASPADSQCSTGSGCCNRQQEAEAAVAQVPGCSMSNGPCCEQGQRNAMQAALLMEHTPCQKVIPAEEVQEMPEIALKSTLNSAIFSEALPSSEELATENQE